MKVCHFPRPTKEHEKPRYTVLRERSRYSGPENADQIGAFYDPAVVTSFLTYPGLLPRGTYWIVAWAKDGTGRLLTPEEWLGKTGQDGTQI